MPSLTQRDRPAWRVPSRVRFAGLALVVLAGVVVSGCGRNAQVSAPSTATMSCTMATCGRAVLTFTDAAGDFLAYQVTIDSLQLRKSDGSLVETIPVATRVDLAGLVALTEVVGAREIPPGIYTGAVVTVDFASATLVVDDGTPNGLPVAPVDTIGAPLGQLTLSVQLDSKHELEIAAGQASRLAFDFNLLASNTVDAVARTVTVNPVLVASIAPLDDKPMRARGTLASVDTTSNEYLINVQPFDDEDSSSKGQVLVHVSGTTTYEINGVPRSGPDGLARLATLGTGTPAVAYGALSLTDQSFLAERVLAGSSVQSPLTDRVSGSVVARGNLTLTLRAREWDGANGEDDVAPGEVTVTIAGDTAVTADGQGSSGPPHSIADISVGSHIDVFGVTSRDASGRVTLDASVGRVRLGATRLAGNVVASAPGMLTLLLQTIDGRDVSYYRFAGTGGPAGRDSDPNSYVVSTGALDLSSLMVGGSTRLFGLVAPFGSAPPDFIAAGLDGAARSTAAVLTVNWAAAGTAAPFAAFDGAHLELDVGNPGIGDHHQIEMGDDREIDLKTLSGNPSIVPDTQSRTALYSIAHAASDSIDNFNTFGDFVARLTLELNRSVKALALFAEGQYDAAANAFTARQVIVRLGD